MSLLKISPSELQKARKAGFRKKAPKKPKRSASVSALESYVSRHNSWIKEAKDASRKLDKKATLLKQIFN